MNAREYLLSYGNAGDFGRFRTAPDVRCRRGDRMVVRSPRGLEIGLVMCEAGNEHARLLKHEPIGEVMRSAAPEDLHNAERLRQRGQALFADARLAAAELDLPLEILDGEILLDATQAVLYYLKSSDCDPRPLLDRVAQRHRLLVTLRDLATPPSEPKADEPAFGSCGSGGCGSGGCGSCGSGKCSDCGAHATPPVPVADSGRVALFST